MNIVLITTASRPQLLKQSLQSLRDNAADYASHHVTIVIDSYLEVNRFNDAHTLVVNTKSQGASASRNIGAGSIPRYRRQEHVLFLDDDVALLSGWDDKLNHASQYLPENTLLSPYGHPFNQEDVREDIPFAKFPLLISSVAAFMSWKAFDHIGFWLEPGGASGSEDYEFCMRATKLGYQFAVLHPHVCIHTGLTSSNGKPIVGADVLQERNAALEKLYRVEGRIIYA